MAALLLVLAAVLALSAPAGAEQLRGADLHPQTLDHSRAAISTEFRMLHSSGATSVRFDIAWHSFEWSGPGQESPGVVAWINWVMRQARAEHLKVILDVWSTPCWASSAPALIRPRCSNGWWKRGVNDYPPRHPDDYARFCAYVAKRWHGYLAAIELWNEPNGGKFFKSNNPARDYAALVRAAYPAVKRVARGLPVLMSMAGTDVHFLGQLYGYGVRGFYDGIAVHPYNDPDLDHLESFRAYQSSRGDDSALWVTEVGWASNSVGLYGQAHDVSKVLTQLARLSYVSAAEIYDMRDSGTNPTNDEDHFGMLDYELRPKPAWGTFVTTVRALARPHSRGNHRTA